MVGSAGTLYGDQAVGGVINIITRRPAAAAHEVRIRTGSFDHAGVQFSSTMHLNESVGYRLSAETFETDNYRDQNANENTNFNGVLEYDRNGNRLFLEVQEIDDEMEVPGALFEDEFEDDPTQSLPSFGEDFINEDTSVYRLGYERDFGGHNFSIDATDRETNADILQSSRTVQSPGAGFITRSNSSVNPKIHGDFGMGLGTPYVFGIDLEASDYDRSIPTGFAPPFDVATASNEQKTESLYFQLNPKITQNLQLTFGMRSSSVENDMTDGFSFPDGIETDDDITVGELGLAYRVSAQTRVSLRYDQNFRFAKIDEFTQAATGDILDTQTGESFEVGIDVTRGNHQFTGSLYRLDLEDEIEFDPTLGPDFGFGPIGLNVNLDKTRRDGLNFSLYSQLGMSFGIRTEIGLVEARFRSGTFDGNDISGVSDAIAKLRGDYRINDYISGYLEYNYSSPRYAQGDNANEFGKLGSITVYNAGIAYRIKAWALNLRINNLADEKYAESINNFGAYFPSPERNYMLTAGYRFD